MVSQRAAVADPDLQQLGIHRHPVDGRGQVVDLAGFRLHLVEDVGTQDHVVIARVHPRQGRADAAAVAGTQRQRGVAPVADPFRTEHRVADIPSRVAGQVKRVFPGTEDGVAVAAAVRGVAHRIGDARVLSRHAVGRHGDESGDQVGRRRQAHIHDAAVLADVVALVGLGDAAAAVAVDEHIERPGPAGGDAEVAAGGIGGTRCQAALVVSVAQVTIGLGVEIQVAGQVDGVVPVAVRCRVATLVLYRPGDADGAAAGAFRRRIDAADDQIGSQVLLGLGYAGTLAPRRDGQHAVGHPSVVGFGRILEDVAILVRVDDDVPVTAAQVERQAVSRTDLVAIAVGQGIAAARLAEIDIVVAEAAVARQPDAVIPPVVVGGGDALVFHAPSQRQAAAGDAGGRDGQWGHPQVGGVAHHGEFAGRDVVAFVAALVDLVAGVAAQEQGVVA